MEDMLQYADMNPDSRIARSMKAAVTQNEAVLNAWVDAVSEGVENYRNQTQSSETTIEETRLSSREQNTAQSLVAQLRNQMQELSDMEPVAEVDGTELNKSLRPVDAAMEYVKSFGGSVMREGFGEVRFSRTKIKSGLVGHGLGNAKMETFAAVPAVIREGKQIGYVDEWKNSHKESYVFAAPVSYKGNNTYVGVIVERDGQSGMYYVHEVVDDNGNVIAFDRKKEEPTSDRLLTLPGRGDTVADSSNDMVTQDGGNVNGEKQRFSSRNQTKTDSFKRWFGDWQNDPQNASKVVNRDGTPMVLYHQTASDFTIFDPKYPGAGTRDNETPFGIFMKSSDKNIGLNGDKQMALYARIVNPLEVQDRQHLTRELEKISPDFSAISEEYRNLNEEYQRKVDDAGEAVRAHMLEWRKAHPDASRRAIYEDARYNELSDAEDALIDEWEEEAKKMEARSKEIITRDLEANGYDGVIILYDKGSFGRSTDTYIALHPEQVKSATGNIGTFDRSNPDIRYSSRTNQDSMLGRLEEQNERLQEEMDYLK